MVDEVLAWYAAQGRDLPWRRTRDPYSVLVSEVMLQQTQVARVAPRFEAWLARWPSAGALAAASAAEVLGAWVGLGYNRRALRLREACAVVAREGWPDTVEGLRGLPGVGPYTARAVAAFAFGHDVAAVDTNVARVVRRAFGARADPQALVPAGGGAAFNHAFMDLGATVCTARAPRCPACPLAARCPGPEPEAPRQAPGGRPRFEDTDRWVRGRVVAGLAAGEGLPAGVAPERLERVLAGLERDGLVVRDGSGGVRLP